MSVDVMTWVFKFSETKLGARLVLLALADYAHDDGSKAFPSVAEIAKKARLSERQVKRCLKNLEEEGHISVDGLSPYGTQMYSILMNQGGDNLSGGVTNDAESQTNDAGSQTNRAETVHDLSPNPSSNPSLTHQVDIYAPAPPPLIADPVIERVYVALLDLARVRKVPKKLLPSRDDIATALKAAPEGVDPEDRLEGFLSHWKLNKNKKLGSPALHLATWLRNDFESARSNKKGGMTMAKGCETVPDLSRFEKLEW